MPNSNIILMEEYNAIVAKFKVKEIIAANLREVSYDGTKTLLWNLSSFNFRENISFKRFVGIINSSFTDFEEKLIVEEIKNERKNQC